MAYCYIDVDDNYNLVINREAALLVPEFRMIVNDEKYGWNHFYYVFLFCSRHPFGSLPEDMRDSRVGTVIEMFPYSKSESNRTFGFYKTKPFQRARDVFNELFPDPYFDTWRGYVNDMRQLNELKAKLDLRKDDDLATLDSYLQLLDPISKLYKTAEKDLQSDMKKKNNSIGMGALEKDLEDT